ncbi:MAG: sulfatase-like hydrolase/transferase [Eubacteriales bacterium]
MDKRKNILHIFTDQLRFDAISAHNNPYIKTPNLDRLIGMGVSFQNAYTPSPVCVAGRCAMITGLYPVKTDCYSNDRMPEDVPTFMQVLTENGYRTHGIGKCHFTPDGNALRGFQTRERQEELSPEALENEPYYQELVKQGYDYTYEAHGVRGPMYYIPQPSRLPSHLHPTNWIGDRTVKFIEENQDAPWYLFSSFIHPHPPFAPPVPWHKLYDPVRMPLPKHTHDDSSMQMLVNKIQNRYKYRDIGMDLNLMRCMKAYYYSCVSFVDYQVGRIIEALEKSGQMDNTMIVFTSDHGELLGDYQCFGKRSMHDAAARIPFVVYEKGKFEGGKKETTPVSLIDLAPTFLGVAGIDASSYEMDGIDIAAGKHDSVYSIFSCYQEAGNGSVKHIPEAYKKDSKLMKAAFGNYMVVNDKWKYIYSAPDQKEFLFDKQVDQETRNLAGVPSCANIQAELKAELTSYLEKEGLSCLCKDGEWMVFPKMELPENPDSGLITQEISCEWYDESLPGYKS